jgi:hypothetical protein
LQWHEDNQQGSEVSTSEASQRLHAGDPVIRVYKLNKNFLNLLPVFRPNLDISEVPTFEWQGLVGFIEAEGCFFCLVRKNDIHLIRYQVTLNFCLVQHIRYLELMIKIKEYLGFGRISISEGSPIVSLNLTKQTNLDPVINLLQGNGLLESKNLDLKDFCKILELITNNLHKTELDLKNLRQIKSVMNFRCIIDEK